MKALPEQGVYAITDCLRPGTDELVKKTNDVLNAGAVMLQYRNKTADNKTRLIQAESLQNLCHKHNVPFIINDDIELARTLNADGVHLGIDDINCRKARIILGPNSIIGISCYNDLNRAIKMQDSGASYIAFGAFYPTQTRANTVKAEPVLIKTAKQKLNIPVVAIGGITPENGKTLIDAGADLLAVISGIYGRKDSFKATQSYVNLFN